MQTPVQTTDAAALAHEAGTRRQCPVARSLSRDQASDTPAEAAVAHWLASADADDFPYDAVVAHFHGVGKHSVPASLLGALAGIRTGLAGVGGSTVGVRLLATFLDVALDKWDGRYANPTYLGLRLLPLPAIAGADQDVAAAEWQYDRLFVQLIVDALQFELAAADGATELLPQMRPDARTTAKRCRLGLQAVGPAMRRLGLGEDAVATDPIAGARRLCAAVAADLSAAERRTLHLTMLPVSLVHDEYQFIRVLQSYEATFALVAVQLHAAVRALADGRSRVALRHISAAERALREAAPLFSLVGTMQLESFLTFREFTEGASAIQSRNYKLVESLCRQPEPSRLDSPAYAAVPEVRQRALAGPATLDGAFEAARATGHVSARELDDLERAMREFAATLRRWRRTHYRLAVRMLGERAGTGYTEGSPYLKAVQAIPVFPSLSGEEPEDGERDGDGAVGSLRPGRLGAHGGCPFAAGIASLAVAGTPRV